MSITGEGMSAADLKAVLGNNDDGFGFGGNGGWWLLVLLLAMNGGWGNGFGFGGGGAAPWLMAGQGQGDIQRGFDQSAIMSALNGLQVGQCGVTQAIQSGFAAAEAAASARQVADLQQQFA